jgi:CheY-like chemotaxis protein
MDGIELSRRLKAENAVKPLIVMISAVEWSTVENEAKGAGVDKFLSKPLFPSALLDCIHECFGSSGALVPENALAAGSAVCFAGYRVLLAEDVEINREIVLTLLEPTGLAIDCAEDGAEAVRMFSADPARYDMILMDVQMPNMDGYEATRSIRALEVPAARRVPIMAMTANVFREDVEKCLRAGMDGHVGKPLDFGEVLANLSRYLPPRGENKRPA